MRKWWGSMVDAAARAMGVPSGAAVEPATRKAAEPASKTVRPSRKKLAWRAGKKAKPTVGAAEVRALAAQGIPRAEIARRTGLSQDSIGLLLNLAPAQPEESAGGGTFFRILEARMAS